MCKARAVLNKSMYAMAERVACIAYIEGRSQSVCKVRVILSVYIHARTERVKAKYTKRAGTEGPRGGEGCERGMRGARGDGGREGSKEGEKRSKGICLSRR